MLIPDEALRSITDRPALYAFLRDRLRWPVDPEDTFAYTGPQLRGPAATRAQVEQIIPFGADDPFAIMLVEFETDFRRGDLREILRAIRADDRAMGKYGGKKPEEVVFVCAERGYAGIRLAHFEQREGRQPRLRAFGWERDQLEGTRTLRDFNLPQIVMPARNVLGEPDWAEGRKRWMAAWDVEKVTKDFFEEYKRVFEQVEATITGVKGDQRLFTQRLFNRLLFVHFLSKKKWLRFHGRTDYLHALWQERGGSGLFYDLHLRPLFFGGLNNPEARDLKRRNPELAAFIGDVPFLNGGLFEQAPDECQGERIPDEAFALILDLFGRYNFTITESTPDDVEVAVDPEMLGKVFEELVTGRHESGSYYTPRPVVAFMCREALKGYVGGYDALVDQHDAGAVSVPEARQLLRRLAAVKVVDPACGSGAYLLGMLHELHALTRILDTRAEEATARDDYQRKLGIIQNNLYGVDLDEFAVNTARLRLWLSLAVEYQGDDPQPLPNLDFKIEQGDSLLAANPQDEAVTFRGELITQYEKAKARYGDPYRPVKEKADLRDQIAELRQSIAEWTHPGKSVEGFDWRVEFAEVFATGGFDIVLANPPYVRADAQFRHVRDETKRQAEIARWKEYRQKLLRGGIYQTLYEKWDLYIPFLERAHQILGSAGRMVFIIPDAYNASKYAHKSHEFFLAKSTVERVDFCSEIDLFDAGVHNTVLHFGKADAGPSRQPVRVRRWGDSRERFEANAQCLPTEAQSSFGARLFRDGAAGGAASTHSSVILGDVCYVSKGMVIHADEKVARGRFRADDLVAGTRGKVPQKPYVEGKDLVRWGVRRIRYLEYGTERAPALFSRPTFPELHEAPERLLAARMCGPIPTVTHDDRGLWANHTVIVFVPWHHLRGVRNASIRKTAKYEDELRSAHMPRALREGLEELSTRFAAKYLLAAMNSDFATRFIAERRRSQLDIYPDDWKALPIADATPAEQVEIVQLVDASIAVCAEHGHPLVGAAAERLSELEREIDERVAALYGL